MQRRAKDLVGTPKRTIASHSEPPGAHSIMMSVCTSSQVEEMYWSTLSCFKVDVMLISLCNRHF